MQRILACAILLTAGTYASAQDLAIKVEKGHVDFLVGKDLVTRYHTTGYTKPIFYPLNAPGNVPVTRAWPMEKGKPNETTDHIHQKSAWFCHGDVVPEGLKLNHKVKGVEGVDFWSENTGHGNIVCVDVGQPKVDANGGHLVTKNEWRTADDIKILDETRKIHFYTLGSARLLVFDIDLHASVFPITFADTKEGAMGIRINDSITEKLGKGKMQNAEGKTLEKQVWGQHSAWCDYSGAINDKVVGLAILADAKNSIPTAWHSRGYGLMAANPFGRIKAAFPATKGNTQLVNLQMGEHLHLRYGLLVHEGDAEKGNVAGLYQRFLDLRAKE